MFLLTVTPLLLLPQNKLNGQQQAPLFRSETELVDLYVTVTDNNGRLAPNLVREDFFILDNGQNHEIALFENDIQPITVVVMLDTSASMTPKLNLLKAGAEQFLLRLLPDDRARVGAFNDKVQLDPPEFIGDRDLLINTLAWLDFGNSTRLYDAVEESLNALHAVEGRKVLLVFTDGDDTDSSIGWKDVLKQAVSEEVMIYAIGLESEYFNGRRQIRSRPDKNLKKFAAQTGGGYFELHENDELGPTFTRVAQELHSQYLLAFSPTVRDGKTHKLEVKVNRPGMKVRARQNYIAPTTEKNK